MKSYLSSKVEQLKPSAVALSDSQQQMDLDQFEKFYKELLSTNFVMV